MMVRKSVSKFPLHCVQRQPDVRTIESSDEEEVVESACDGARSLSSTNSSDFGTPMSSAEFIRSTSDSGKGTATSRELQELFADRGLMSPKDPVARLDEICQSLKRARSRARRRRREVYVVKVTRFTSLLRANRNRNTSTNKHPVKFRGLRKKQSIKDWQQERQQQHPRQKLP